MQNKVVSTIFTVLGFLLMLYAVLLIFSSNFKQTCYTDSSGHTICEGGMDGAGPTALVAIASMVAAVATRPANDSASPTQRVEPYVDRSARSNTTSYGAPTQSGYPGQSTGAGPYTGPPSASGQ